MYLIVGCGLSGAVIAEKIATKLNQKVLIIDKRDHIGGNCYDYIDSDTGIRMCKYGAHIFRTNNETVWEYINKYSEWVRWEHKVLSKVDNRFVCVPVNITTVNELCNQNIQTSKEMDQWLEKNQVKYDEEIVNSEQSAKAKIGEVLYEKMIRPYTLKQWDREPKDLDKSVLKNIPVRNNFDTRYFDHKYQVLPENGYTKFIQNILDHPNIEVKLNTPYNSEMKADKIIFTGPIDRIG